MDVQEISVALSRFVNVPVLVIGDLMIDEYLWGHVERISQEAPVQVVDVTRDEFVLGGAGNVVKNMVDLGAEVHVSSAIDGGDNGQLILTELEKLGVDAEGVFTESGKVSSRKTRILSFDTHQQILRVDRETLHPISDATSRRILSYLRTHVPRYAVVVLSDYAKGSLPRPLVRQLIGAAAEAGIPVVVDPKGDDYGAYRGAAMITPNRREAETVLRMQLADDESLRAGGARLLEEIEAESVLITLGKDGMALFEGEGTMLRIPAEERTVYDVTGAGDTVVSVVGLGLAAGLTRRQAVEIANIAAGIVVSKIGTATVTVQEIVDEVLRKGVSYGDKLLGLSALEEQVEEKRKTGKRIVFTNGCFDILHAGHTSFLQRARSLGDILVVGLNSDQSVRRLKGKGRPIIPLRDRAAVLSSLSSVDYVTVFDEDTPLALIEALKPDVLVKGNDYRRDQVVGGDVVESYGGRVELVELREGISTTRIIQRIMQNGKTGPNTPT
jgi:D-beta-D-heptose 7-phosphate kinase/D-beta-D-heptose 1-phosphate adenosyltransferase